VKIVRPSGGEEKTGAAAVQAKIAKRDRAG
jgi:hypothetical protein